VSTTRLLIEYDGAPFAGWSYQPGERSIRAEVERALATLLRAPAALTVAGRTDRGVHAWGQVASYDGEPANLRSLNALLPAEIAVLEVAAARDGFSARHDAHSRTYCYRVLNRRARSARLHHRVLWVAHPLDAEALDACAAALAGRHDFTAFTPTETEHVWFRREVFDARWERHGDLLEFWIEADTFLRHMNRVLVGTMLQVAMGRRTLEDFTGLLGGAPRNAAGPTAAPHALALASVRYDEDPAT
jgi:tRNA pseudouridine38-40 synthase